MKKNLLRKIVTAVIAATTITSFSSLGVSAATTNSTYDNNYNDYYNYMANNLMKTGWVMNNDNWYFFNNAGEMQTGVIKVNGQTYCLNQSGKMEIGKVLVNNRVYTTNKSGQVVGAKAPTVDKVFDSNSNVIKDNNKTSTVTKTNSGAGKTTTGGTTNTGNTTSTSTPSTGTNTTTTNAGSTTNSGSTSNTATSATSIDQQGLPALPSNYSITVQADAEQKILDLMNQKRTEAGLKPLVLDNTLIKVARYKSDDMIQNNFFDHTNPDGTKWTNWLQDLGYSYTSAGENIAYNTYDAVELFTQWWNSPSHRANMMNSSYTKVGIGVLLGNGKYMGTQEFSN
ncbi:MULTISPECIES: CAP domain-containing protein [unclassified Clostridium]|uniref:CAP domain-containing protein n=1 Tax=unclassified Clostridium TaxID=2614128 RepID=UPI000297DDD2|nr:MULTISPECIES: CAP domain-containing protein [unclassified Clostridium]EKQ51739.1 MAG: putative SCP/PR1 domain containing protein [Clostridium sp. Maddingley MBC34-26]